MPAAARVLPVTELSTATSLPHAEAGDASSQEVPNSAEPQQGSQFRSAIEVDGPRWKQSQEDSRQIAYSPIPALSIDPNLPEEFDLAVPARGQVPAALLQSVQGPNQEAPFTSAQQKLANHLAREFAREATQNGMETKSTITAPTTGANQDALNRWRDLATKSDERFRSLFGQDAYNRETIRQYHLNDQAPPKTTDQ